jgi:mannose-6-phosphate isomerase
MQRITGVVQHYSWGHPSAIAELVGRVPSGEPEAELWFGAHPSAPSATGDGAGLDALIAADPVGMLGAEAAVAHGELPFLLKVIAAAQPLSIQAHPNAEQARAGFERENAAGIALDTPDRIYRDANPKPELVCALTPFEALCGFRPLAGTLDLFDALGDGVEPVVERLRAPGTDAEVLAGTVAWLLRDASSEVVVACLEACRMLERPGWAVEAQTAIDAATHFGSDPGVVVSLLLNRVTLRPGEALALGSGNLHAYLSGVAVEVMANSDNVVRGGLTHKHVDIAELLDVVDCTPIRPDVQRPDDWNHRYRSGATQFTLHRYEVGGGRRVAWQRDAPAIALVTRGAAVANGTTFERGDAVFVAANEEATISGDAEVFLATTG